MRFMTAGGRGRTVAAAAVAAVLAAGGIAYAAAGPSADGTITACVKSSGDMRVAGSATDCRSNETALTWNQRGPAGPKGDAGPAGPKGSAGPAGPRGDAGPAGPAGPKGADGAPGADGEDGAPGADGADGAQGEKGDKGDPGADGPQGEKGDKGDPGADGANGAEGPQGPQGEKGEKGDPGPAGPAGGGEGAGSPVYVEASELDLRYARGNAPGPQTADGPVVPAGEYVLEATALGRRPGDAWTEVQCELVEPAGASGKTWGEFILDYSENDFGQLQLTSVVQHAETGPLGRVECILTDSSEAPGLRVPVVIKATQIG